MLQCMQLHAQPILSEGLTSADKGSLVGSKKIGFFQNALVSNQPKVFNLSRDILLMLSLCVYCYLYERIP